MKNGSGSVTSRNCHQDNHQKNHTGNRLEIMIHFNRLFQRCQEKGSTLSETLVGFMVKSVVLDPSANFSVDRTLTQEDVDR